MRLRNALRALLGPERLKVDPEHVSQLADRLAALEELQTKREADWEEWQERMLRYLRRIEGANARAKQLAGEEEDGYAVAKRTALGMKFHRNNGA